MNLGIIGPKTSVAEAITYLEKVGLPLLVTALAYDSYTQVPQLLDKSQKNLDAVLFTGMVPFNYAMCFVQPQCPWDVIPLDKLSLVFTLLKAGFVKKFDITRISIDNYDGLIGEAYRELNYSLDDVSIILAPNNIFDKNYLQDLLDFHLSQYRAGRTNCVLTGIEFVYNSLSELNIPCMMISKAFDAVIQATNKLLLRQNIDKLENIRIVTLAVYIEYLEDHPAHERNILQILHYKDKVRDSLYVFAQKTGAAIFESGENKFYLCLHGDYLTAETQNFSSLEIIQVISSVELVKHIFVGIGIAQTAFQAKQHAELGIQHCRKIGRSCAFILDAEKNIFGPVIYGKSTENFVQLDVDLHTIAARSGVSVQALSRLYAIIRQYGLETATTKKLAQLYGSSERNLHRILLKLEEAGYVKQTGQENILGPGRPRKIIQFNLGL